MKQNLPFVTFSFGVRARTYLKTSIKSAVLGLTSLFLMNDSQAQSRSALSFDGTNDFVFISTVSFNSSYTKEAWVFFTGNNANLYNIVSGNSTAFWINNGQLSAGHIASGFTQIQDPALFPTNVWTHVAVTYDAGLGELRLYKNGVQVAGPVTPQPFAEGQQQIGAYFDGTNYIFPWLGRIDEVRIWDVARSAAQIRDFMCQSVPSDNPNFGDLLGYYKSDDGSGTNLDDFTGVNDGTLFNGPTWVTSGAPIGAASVHDYVNATKTATITFTPTGESFTATSSAGSPDAIHVYRVDESPTEATGITGLGDNNKYFGVFQVGGTAPTYTAVYFYSNIPLFPNESVVRLFKRADNAAASWADASATLDDVANTLTVTGETTEYILGAVGYSLPVTFGDFRAIKGRNGVDLTWTTVTEINNAGFYVQRSTGNNNWVDLGFVAGAGNSNTELQYSFADINPVRGLNYYRIRQVDRDGRTDFSSTRVINVVTKTGVTVYPNPTTGFVTININQEGLLNTEAKMIDLQGKILKRFIINGFQESISTEGMKPGMYYLQLADGSVHQIVKQ